MARRNVGHTTGAVLGATAMALVGSPAADSTQPHLTLLSSDGDTSEHGSALHTPGLGLGGLGMGKSAIPAGAFAPGMSGSPTTHTVKAGDTVWALAKSYNTTVNRIIEANGLGSNALIRVGQKLTIPGKNTTTSKPPAGPQASPKTHTVRAGQTLSGIAATYGTTTAQLTATNKLANPNFIRVGQVLTISGSSAHPSAPSRPGHSSKPSTKAPTPGSSATSYTVRAGDTVWGIARAYKVTTNAIIAANGLRSDALIRVGQKLTIPHGSSSGSTPGTSPSPGAPAPENNACKNLVPSTFLHYTYPEKVVRAANQNKCTLEAMSVPSRDAMQSLVRQTAAQMGVDPALALAVAYQESGFNQRAVSPANAIGTMQVIPSSGDWAGQLLGRQINLLDPHDNVAAGVAILRALQRSFPTNLDYAIGAYYQGAGSVSRYGLAADTQNYVKAIKAHMARFQ